MSGLWHHGGRRADREKGSRSALAGSVLLHGLCGFLAVAPVASRAVLPPVYRVELVAAPRPQPQARRAPEVVQRPAAQSVPTVPRPQRTPAPAPPSPATGADVEPAARTSPDTLAPGAEPSTGSDPATVSTSGVLFQFPEYLANIVGQVHRRWQRPSGNVSLRAEVMFFIHRDGTVTNFRFVTRSGNFGFDLEAQGAIEAAANAGAFGPLPEGYPADVLPVSFFFDPSLRR